MAKKRISCAKGSAIDLQRALEQKIFDLGGEIESSESIEGASGSVNDMIGAMKDKLEDAGIESSEAIEASSNAAKKYRNYEQFVDRCYPEFNILEEDMDVEIFAVEHEIKKLGGDPNLCPTYWRSDYDEPIVEVDGDYYFVTFRGVEARLTPINEDIFGELSTYGIEACGDVYSNESISCKYKLEDTYGAPQAGVDIQYFDTYEELEEYIEAHPDVQERMSEGYAQIKEC